MFLWNLTGRQRWTDAGPQVWRFVLIKLSDIWKRGRKTSLWFCSQVKFVAARTAVGFFFQAKSPPSVLPWRSFSPLVFTCLQYFNFTSLILSFYVRLSTNAWLLYSIFLSPLTGTVCPHKESHYRPCKLHAWTRNPNFSSNWRQM